MAIDRITVTVRQKLREDQKSIDKPVKLARIKIIQEQATGKHKSLRRAKLAEYFIATL